MSSIETIENKLSYIEKHLSSAKYYQKYSQESLRTDDVIRNALERELYLIAQAVIDLSEAIIAYKNFRKPTTMRESLEILSENDLVPKTFLENFIKIVGFRNALAHGYEDLRIEVIYDVLHHNLIQVEEFLSYIKNSILS